MNLLADEKVDSQVVARLRNEGLGGMGGGAIPKRV
jgi:hypothetical protein